MSRHLFKSGVHFLVLSGWWSRPGRCQYWCLQVLNTPGFLILLLSAKTVCVYVYVCPKATKNLNLANIKTT